MGVQKDEKANKAKTRTKDTDNKNKKRRSQKEKPIGTLSEGLGKDLGEGGGVEKKKTINRWGFGFRRPIRREGGLSLEGEEGKRQRQKKIHEKVGGKGR